MNIFVDALPVRRPTDVRAWESRLMNRHLRVWVAVLGMSVSSSMVVAQVVPATNAAAVPPISVGTRGSEAITPDQKAEIDANVTANLQIVATGSPAEQTAARKSLIAQAPNKQGGLTPQFLDAFAQSIDAKISSALKSKLPMRTKINFGVIAAEVAKNTESHQLSNSAELLLKDDQEVVALWGAKTAKFVVPGYVKLLAGKKNTLLPLMVDTGKKFPGPVLWEIYEGLTLGPLSLAGNPRNVPAAKAQIGVVLPFLHDLLKARAATYGPAVPKEVMADAQGTSFLTLTWTFQAAAQQKQSATIMRDMINKAAPLYQPGNTDMIEMIKRVSSGLGVVVSSVKTESDAIQKFNQSTPAIQVVTAVTALVTALDASPLMTAPAGAPAVQNGPASRPASGGSSPASNLAVIK